LLVALAISFLEIWATAEMRIGIVTMAMRFLR
jgi:hypothetical protein